MLEPPRSAIEVPVPEVSIPDPAALAATVQLAPAAAAAAVEVSTTVAPAPAQPLTAPRFDAAYLHNPAPQYPPEARRSREQGSVMLRVRVSHEGAAMEVSIEHSSGYPRLDESAMSAVKRWRFVPARRGSDPVEAWVLVPVDFELRR
jgi:protein TonB